MTILINGAISAEIAIRSSYGEVYELPYLGSVNREYFFFNYLRGESTPPFTSI